MVFLTVLGGILITISTSTYLYMNGKIAGFSGMLWSAISQDENKRNKSLFLLTMMMTNSFVYIFSNFFNLKSDLYDSTSKQTNGVSFIGFLISGFLVGYGTKLGNGCTSGHGVCGLPRLSKRSWVFITIMMVSAILTANFKLRFNLFNHEHEITNDGFMTLVIIMLVFITSVYFLYDKYIKQWNNMITKDIQQDITTMFSAVLFTLGLVLAGFVKRDKVLNFLVISKNWDYSLMIILGVAVGLNLIIFKIIFDKKQNYHGDEFQLAKNNEVDKYLIIGGIIFGIGWGISSLCPGPALLLFQFATFKISCVFTLSMIAGQFAADKTKDFL